MSDLISLRSCRISVVSEDFLTLTFEGNNSPLDYSLRDKRIYIMDWAFNFILKEFGLNKDSYKILLSVDRSLLQKLLGKKSINLFVSGDENEFVGLSGQYSSELITYINANSVYIDYFRPKEKKLEFSTKNFYFESSAFSDKLIAHSVVMDDKPRIVSGVVDLDILPMIKDFGSLTEIPVTDVEVFDITKLNDICFSIYDLLKFKNLIRNFLEWLTAIIHSLGIENISDVSNDYKSILINTPVIDLWNNLRSKSPFDCYDFLHYFLTDEHLKYRSNYNKLISINI